MILLVFGTHLDVQEALEMLGKPTDYRLVTRREIAESILPEGMPNIVLGGIFDRRMRLWRDVEILIEKARKLDRDLVIETAYPEIFEHYAKFADYIFVGKTMFRRLEK